MTTYDDLPLAPTLADTIRAAARRFPDNGMTFYDMRGEARFLDYVAIERETALRAGALQAMGLKKGDRLGLVAIEPEHFVLTFLAAVRVGIVPVPLYPPLAMNELEAYTERLVRVLGDAGATAIITSGKLQHLLWGVVDRVESLRWLATVESLERSDTQPSWPTIVPEDLCFLQYTSGSTSDPKGVIVTHESLRANSTGIMSHLEMRPERDRALSWLPLYHDMGLIGFVVATTFWGVSTVYLPTPLFLRRPNTWLRACSDHGATITFCPPFALHLAASRAQEADLERWDLSRLRHVGVGAEPIHPAGMRAFTSLFHEHCGLPQTAVLPAYGMAEATLAIGLKPSGTKFKTRHVDEARFQGEGVAQPRTEGRSIEHVSCGVPLAGHEVVVVDPATGRHLAEGVEGELCVRGASVTPGYHANETATRRAFRDGWLHTGDLGYLHEGEIYVTGRLKDLIILRGRNIHPQAIEWSVQRIEGVRKGNVVAFSIPGDPGERVVIALERTADDEDLERRVGALVAREYGARPHAVVVLQRGQLPKTSSGKLQRRKVRQLYLRGELRRRVSRAKDHKADPAVLARQVATSMWTRAKYAVLRR